MSLRSPTVVHQSLRSPVASLPKRKKGADEGSRLLIMVCVMGSAGPLRMVVGEGNNVGDIISFSLKLYAREGHLPVMGSNAAQFDLHCTNTGSGALDYWQEMRSCGSRNFLLCKKPTAFESALAKHEGNSVGRLRAQPRSSLSVILPCPLNSLCSKRKRQNTTRIRENEKENEEK